MKYTFFIEGGDNVGKTTTINTLKEAGFIKTINSNNVSFSKYPSESMTEYLNTKIPTLKKMIEEIRNSSENLKNYVEEHNAVIKELLKDMKNSFIDTNKSKDVSVEIADRGFLSTYIYQFKALLKLDVELGAIDSTVFMDREIIHLVLFILAYLMPMYDTHSKESSNINVVILYNNNPQEKLSEATETIEYKKNFDTDKDLQNEVNTTLDNLVSVMTKSDEFVVSAYNVSHIRFHYINIYNNNVRRIPDDICNELIDIINSQIKEENK